MKVFRFVKLVEAVTDWAYGDCHLIDISNILDIEYRKLYHFLMSANICDINGMPLDDSNPRKTIDCMLLAIAILSFQAEMANTESIFTDKYHRPGSL